MTHTVIGDGLCGTLQSLELVRDKKIEGISDVRDESDKDGMRIVFELKRNEIAKSLYQTLAEKQAAIAKDIEAERKNIINQASKT